MISNIHTHSTFCDGKDTPEQMVQTAIEQGLTALGFSGHSYTPFDSDCPGMSPEAVRQYKAEIARLREVYGDRITLYTGIEQDYDSESDDEMFDYRIGSIHFLPGKDPAEAVSIDASEESFLHLLNDEYDGDMLSLVETYCTRELMMFETMHPDVVGHFDLYRKFNDSLHYLDESDSRYLSLVKDTLHQLVRQDALLEVNLGAIARGKAHEPYPSVALLKFLQQEKARLIITTDCHDRRFLTYRYDETVELLKALGFPQMTVMGRHGFEEITL